MEREITPRQIDSYKASQIYGISDDRLKEEFRHGQFRTAFQTKRKKWFVNRSEIEWRRLRDITPRDIRERTAKIEILTRFRIFQALAEEVKPREKFEEFLKEAPICVTSIVPGGIPYSLVLLSYLIDRRGLDASFICLGETEAYDSALVQDTAVLIVDDVSIQGILLKKQKQ